VCGILIHAVCGSAAVRTALCGCPAVCTVVSSGCLAVRAEVFSCPAVRQCAAVWQCAYF